MCDFFSFITDNKGKKYFFTEKQRLQIRNNAGEMKYKYYEEDSHTSIANYYGLNDDKVNKYEYVPKKQGWKFRIDQINIKDTSRDSKKWAQELPKSFLFTLLNSDDAYRYCKKVQDRKEVRDRITDSFDAYRYCKDVQDREEVRDRITDSQHAYYYCKYVQDREEFRDRITDSYWAYCYCREVKDRKEVRDRITDSVCAYYYCKYVEDRKEVRDRITDSEYAYRYCNDVKDRPEMREIATKGGYNA